MASPELRQECQYSQCSECSTDIETENRQDNINKAPKRTLANDISRPSKRRKSESGVVDVMAHTAYEYTLDRMQKCKFDAEYEAQIMLNQFQARLNRDIGELLEEYKEAMAKLGCTEQSLDQIREISQSAKALAHIEIRYPIQDQTIEETAGVPCI